MKKILYCAAMILVSQFAFSQKQTGHICETDQYNKELEAQNPEYAKMRAAFNDAYRAAMKNYNPNDYRTTNGLGKANGPIYIIPVVVHVFHNNGGDNISDAQIISEINFLNQSFRKLNPDTGNIRQVFRDIAADSRIEFRLVKKDPQGNCTNGIVRYQTELSGVGNDELKKKSSWDTKKYFNMWIVENINRGGSSSGGEIIGYAQFPFFAGGASSAVTDGIMVNRGWFGQTGNISPKQSPFHTTTTHEVGHWLGLFHPFQGDSCDSDNDGILETPFTYNPGGVTRNVNNPAFNSCSADNPDLVDQQENYMDYFECMENCANMFTLQQVARMHFCLENYRRELWQPANLVATGVDGATTCTALPIPRFSTTTPGDRVCIGSPVSFRDNSYNATVNAWSWNFGDGAVPATATTQNPTVQWSTPGWKTVSLSSTGPNGTGSFTRTEYIYVEGPGDYKTINTGVSNADWDYLNSFLQDGWSFENDYPTNQWKVTSVAKVNGINSLMLETRNIEIGSYALVSPTFNLTNSTIPYLSFNYSFAANYISPANTNDSRDGMQIQVSYDCGKTWLIRKTVDGEALAATTPNPLTTAGIAVQGTQYYVPINPNHWRVDGISGASVGSGAQLGSVKFKILFKYRGGNNFYLDAVSVGVRSSVAELTAKDIQFAVVPNPFNQTATINYELAEPAPVQIELFDIVGKKVATLFTGNQSAGAQTLTFGKQEYNLNSGLYFVKTTVNNNSFSTKILVND
jgi:PKD repeat protein